MTLWISQSVLQHWRYQGPRPRGAQPTYSDLAIEATLSLRRFFI